MRVFAATMCETESEAVAGLRDFAFAIVPLVELNVSQICHFRATIWWRFL
jgi:hypothetical protein